MNISHLIRDPSKIHADLTVLPDDSLITKKGCKLYIPESYQNQKLVLLDSVPKILGICAIVVDDMYYGVSRAITKLSIAPDVINTVKINDEHYLEFVFYPESSVITNINTVQDNSLLYLVYNEFIAKGHIPWYINYYDLGHLFEFSKDTVGVALGANNAIHEMIAATVCKDPKDLNRHYRHVIHTMKDLEDNPFTLVKLMSVGGATNTTAKLIGSYWGESVNSALINPSKTVEPIERLLRK